MVKSIKVLMETISVRVIHFFRESNTLVDFFTNLLFSFIGDFHFNNVEHVPEKRKSYDEVR